MIARDVLVNQRGNWDDLMDVLLEEIGATFDDADQRVCVEPWRHRHRGEEAHAKVIVLADVVAPRRRR